MEKDWEPHREEIASLYMEHPLVTVRQIMIDQYGFQASIRAYRNRLDRWGIRRYVRRRFNDEETSTLRESLHISPYRTAETGDGRNLILPKPAQSRLLGWIESQSAELSNPTQSDILSRDSTPYVNPPENAPRHRHGSLAAQEGRQYVSNEYNSSQE